MNDDIEKDIRVFLIDEDKTVSGTSGGIALPDTNLTSQITNLTQQVNNLQTQLATILEITTGKPIIDEEKKTETQAKIQQVDLPPGGK